MTPTLVAPIGSEPIACGQNLATSHDRSCQGWLHK